ncbi:MAG TPA: EboA domain-containing protein [Dyadobacter sp.]|jgi:hypothetical protein|nr:EboA domain-containing protein [Dyadobacter sp.]
MSDFITKSIFEILSQNTTEAELAWLEQKSKAESMEVMTAFVACPRFLSKTILQPTAEAAANLQMELPGFSVQGWSLVRLARVWLLTQLDSSDKDVYVNQINTLFDTAELNELVALYSALPLLSCPDQWLFRATDAVRSNMGFVFDAIALRNPYPEKYFSESAWNQLVMKTIFNDKPVNLLEGLDNRANDNLAFILSDFAHERWAAGRSVPAQVWRLTSPFLNETLVNDMRHLLESNVTDDQHAAALVCYESGYEPALNLLAQYPELKNQVSSGKIAWADFETNDLNA